MVEAEFVNPERDAKHDPKAMRGSKLRSSSRRRHRSPPFACHLERFRVLVRDAGSGGADSDTRLSYPAPRAIPWLWPFTLLGLLIG